MDARGVASALAIVFGSLVAGCSASGPQTTVAAATSTNPATGAVTIPTDSGNVTVPAGTGGTTGSGVGTAGPSEKDKQRGNTPPGMSRDGAGPLGGAIIDPTGATGKR